MQSSVSFIDGPSGPLECLITQSDPAVPALNITAVICHPHPQFSGTMNNKVVTTLMQICRDLGMSSIRFNFRGVGQSAGTYGEGAGELQDCLAVIDWVKQHQPNNALLLAGFSFGGCIAMQAAAQANPIGLITIAPPVEKMNAIAIPPINCPWIMVQGEKDTVVPPHTVYQFVAKRAENITLLRLPEAEHFFHGQLGVLKRQVTEAMNECGILA